jgi:hypothetical protein
VIGTRVFYFAFFALLAVSSSAFAFGGRLPLFLSGKNRNQARQGNYGWHYRSERLAFQDAKKDKPERDDGKNEGEYLPAPAFFQRVLDNLFFVFTAMFGFLFRQRKDAVCRARERLLIITEFIGGRQWANVH